MSFQSSILGAFHSITGAVTAMKLMSAVAGGKAPSQPQPAPAAAKGTDEKNNHIGNDMNPAADKEDAVYINGQKVTDPVLIERVRKAEERSKAAEGSMMAAQQEKRERRNARRRELYAQNKDSINARRRELYAEKKLKPEEES